MKFEITSWAAKFIWITPAFFIRNMPEMGQINKRKGFGVCWLHWTIAITWEMKR